MKVQSVPANRLYSLVDVPHLLMQENKPQEPYSGALIFGENSILDFFFILWQQFLMIPRPVHCGEFAQQWILKSMMSFQFLHLLVRPPLSNNGPTQNSRECICAQNHQQDPRVHSWARLKKNTAYKSTNTNPNLKIEDTFQNQIALCGTCRFNFKKVF